jgi:hypothetical protein
MRHFLFEPQVTHRTPTATQIGFRACNGCGRPFRLNRPLADLSGADFVTVTKSTADADIWPDMCKVGVEPNATGQLRATFERVGYGRMRRCCLPVSDVSNPATTVGRLPSG